MSWKGQAKELLKDKKVSHCAIIDKVKVKVYDSTDGFELKKHSVSIKNEEGKEVKY